MDPYKVLWVKKLASSDEVETAYHEAKALVFERKLPKSL